MPSSNRVSNIESKLIYLFGQENTKKDLIIGKKYAELFGNLPNQNRNIIRDCKMKKKSYILVWCGKKACEDY